MRMNLTARNMVITPAITERVEKKTRAMGRYLPQNAEMNIRMRKEKSGLRIVEITVPLGNNVILRSEASAEDNLFLAIDQALVKMEKQIHRHRTKLSKRLREDAFEQTVPEYLDEEPAEETESKIVRRKTFPVRPMSEEDAAIQMELLGHSFFAFMNIDTNSICVLYARKDGTLGLLEPEV